MRLPMHKFSQTVTEKAKAWRSHYISSSSKLISSTGKSPTLTLSGFTNTPLFGGHSKYFFPLTLQSI